MEVSQTEGVSCQGIFSPTSRIPSSKKAFLWGVIQFHHVLVHISQIDVFYPASCSYISLIDGGNPSRGRFYAKEFPASLQGYLAQKSLLWGVGEWFFFMLTIQNLNVPKKNYHMQCSWFISDTNGRLTKLSISDVKWIIVNSFWAAPAKCIQPLLPIYLHAEKLKVISAGARLRFSELFQYINQAISRKFYMGNLTRLWIRLFFL